jgi:hypothetical protein
LEEDATDEEAEETVEAAIDDEINDVDTGGNGRFNGTGVEAEPNINRDGNDAGG